MIVIVFAALMVCACAVVAAWLIHKNCKVLTANDTTPVNHAVLQQNDLLSVHTEERNVGDAPHPMYVNAPPIADPNDVDRTKPSKQLSALYENARRDRIKKDRISLLEEELAAMKVNIKECLSKKDDTPRPEAEKNEDEESGVHSESEKDVQLKSLAKQLVVYMERKDHVKQSQSAESHSKSDSRAQEKSVGISFLAATNAIAPGNGCECSETKEVPPTICKECQHPAVGCSKCLHHVSPCICIPQDICGQEGLEECHIQIHPLDSRLVDQLTMSKDQNRKLLNNLAEMKVKLAKAKREKNKKKKKSSRKRRKSKTREPLDSCPELDLMTYDDIGCESDICRMS